MLQKKENRRAESGGALGPGQLGRGLRRWEVSVLKKVMGVGLLEREKFLLGKERIHQAGTWEEQARPRHQLKQET